MTENGTVEERAAEAAGADQGDVAGGVGSRRGLLAAMAAGVGAVGLLARPVGAAAGDPVRLGRKNYSGGSSTLVQGATSGGPVLTVRQAANGSRVALRVDADLAPGVLVQSKGKNRNALSVTNAAGEKGSGSAINARGSQQVAIRASNNHKDSPTVVATNAAEGGPVARFRNTSGATGTGTGPAVQGIASPHTVSDLNNATQSFPAAGGEFIGQHGVIGASTTFGHAGVLGKSTNGFGRGVIGEATGSDGAGVMGVASGSATLAGIFQGNVNVAGTLSKSAGSFVIDHPLDPENRLLAHSFVESPDMMNVYNGNTTIGEDGTAVVELPTYFGALNRDFRYQLTAIGGQADLWIHEKIADNRFVIGSDTPGVEVSWQVTGIRDDTYAREHPIVVERDKDAEFDAVAVAGGNDLG